jgi:hypothetical protein
MSSLSETSAVFGIPTLLGAMVQSTYLCFFGMNIEFDFFIILIGSLPGF